MALRRLSVRILEAGSDLPRLLGNALTAPFDTADRSFLYQRWCGLQLLGALEAEGWRVLDDRVGPLFLGGVVPLRSTGIIPLHPLNDSRRALRAWVGDLAQHALGWAPQSAVRVTASTRL